MWVCPDRSELAATLLMAGRAGLGSSAHEELGALLCSQAAWDGEASSVQPMGPAVLSR